MTIEVYAVQPVLLLPSLHGAGTKNTSVRLVLLINDSANKFNQTIGLRRHAFLESLLPASTVPGHRYLHRRVTLPHSQSAHRAADLRVRTILS